MYARIFKILIKDRSRSVSQILIDSLHELDLVYPLINVSPPKNVVKLYSDMRLYSKLHAVNLER